MGRRKAAVVERRSLRVGWGEISFTHFSSLKYAYFGILISNAIKEAGKKKIKVVLNPSTKFF